MATRLRCYGCNEVGHIRENCPYGETPPDVHFVTSLGTLRSHVGIIWIKRETSLMSAKVGLLQM